MKAKLRHPWNFRFFSAHSKEEKLDVGEIIRDDYTKEDVCKFEMFESIRAERIR